MMSLNKSRLGLVLIVAGGLALLYILPMQIRAISQAESKESLPPPSDMPIPGMDNSQPPPTTGKAPPLPSPPPQSQPGSVGIPSESLPPPVFPPPGANGASGATAKALPELPPEIELGDETFKYDPTGRRDPFRSFLKVNTPIEVVNTPPPTAEVKEVVTRDKLFQEQELGNSKLESLTSLDSEQFSLVGILWEVKDPKAMLKTPTGKVFTVRQQTRLGRRNGYVAAIREGEVVVIEMSQDGRRPVSRLLTIAK